MKRRIILILVIAVVLGGAVTGTVLWIQRNSGPSLLRRTDVAIRAAQYDKALVLAGKYIIKQPDDWRGYYKQGEANMYQGKYDEARASFQKAVGKASGELLPRLAEARTWSLPALQKMTSGDASDMKEATDGFDTALSLLQGLLPAGAQGASQPASAAAGFQAVRPEDKLDLLEAIGLIQSWKARALDVLASQYNHDAAVAKAGGGDDTELVNKYTQARKLAEGLKKEALYNLFLAVQMDPQVASGLNEQDKARWNRERQKKREQASQVLVQLCVDSNDPEVMKILGEVREAIMKLPAPSPIARMKLVDYDLGMQVRADAAATTAPATGPGAPTTAASDTAASIASVQTAGKALDDLLADVAKTHPNHPDLLQIKLRRAELAVRLGRLKEASDPDAAIVEYKKAEGLCDQVLGSKGDSRNMNARLFRAQAWLQEGVVYKAQAEAMRIEAQAGNEEKKDKERAELLKLAQVKFRDAEDALGKLAVDLPESIQVQYYYGMAAQNMGKTTATRDAMRAVTKLIPKYQDDIALQDRAQRVLASSLAQGGFNDTAYAEAKGYYEKKRKQKEDTLQDLRASAKKAADAGDNAAATAALEALAKAEKENDVDALRLLVGAAGSAGDSTARAEAIDALALAEKESTGQVEVMLTVVEGYEMLAEPVNARRVRDQVQAQLKAALEKNPDDARLHSQMAAVYASKGENLLAMQSYRTASRLEPGNLSYHVSLARLLLDAGQLDAANAECQEIIKLDPSNHAAARISANARLMTGQLGDSADIQEDITAGLMTGPRAAVSLLQSDQVDKCIEMCLKELKDRPDDAEWGLVLARAYMLKHQPEEAVKYLEVVLKSTPDDLRIYQGLAQAYGPMTDYQDRIAKLKQVPNVTPRNDLASLAVAAECSRLTQFELAIKIYDKVINDTATTALNGIRAQFGRAQALASMGRFDGAIADLDDLAKRRAVRQRALFLKARMVSLKSRPGSPAEKAGRIEAAKEIYAQVVNEAIGANVTEQGTGIGTLSLVVEDLAGLELFDEALKVSDQIVKLDPANVRGKLLRAALLASPKRLGETDQAHKERSEQAIRAHREAIAQAPDSPDAYIRLARHFAELDRPVDALKTLDELQSKGEAGKTEAAYERGMMFSRWGLRAEAVKAFDTLSQLTHAPNVLVMLGKGLIQAGEVAKARDVLNQVPPYAVAQYVESRLLLTNLAENLQDKLAILDKTEEVRPDRAAVLTTRMDVLVTAGQMSEAVKAFQAVVSRSYSSGPIPQELAALGLRAMVAANDLPAAVELASRMISDSDVRWQMLAVLLSMDSSADKAAGLLKIIPAKATPAEAVLGLCLALQKGEDGQAWMARIRQAKPEELAPSVRLLTALAGGDQAEAEALLGGFRSQALLSRAVANDLVKAGKSGDGKARAAATRLLKVSLASDLGMAPLACTWAVELLKSQPTCQWAAAQAIMSNRDVTQCRDVLGILQPADCVLATLLRAMVLSAENKPGEAAELFGQLLQGDPENVDLLLQQASNLQRVNRLEEALAIYRKLWQTLDAPAMANNAAYLLAQLGPKDPARLNEALSLIEQAMKKTSGDASSRDTRGWIFHLLGRNEEACADLRAAARGLPDSPEVHYHVGMAEAAMKNKDLARWHLQAAIDLGSQKTSATTAPAEEPAFVKAARDALKELDSSTASNR